MRWRLGVEAMWGDRCAPVSVKDCCLGRHRPSWREQCRRACGEFGPPLLFNCLQALLASSSRNGPIWIMRTRHYAPSNWLCWPGRASHAFGWAVPVWRLPWPEKCWIGGGRRDLTGLRPYLTRSRAARQSARPRHSPGQAQPWRGMEWRHNECGLHLSSQRGARSGNDSERVCVEQRDDTQRKRSRWRGCDM